MEEHSGNGNAGFLPTGNGTGTLVIWDQAPAWAVAARYEFRGHERVVPVNNGIVLATFDDTPEVAWDAFHAWPRLASWIDANGVDRETQ